MLAKCTNTEERMESKFELINELVQMKIPFRFDSDGDLIVDGFSKSGEAVLKWESGLGWISYTRYDRKDIISIVDNLLDLAYTWYKKSASDYKLPPLLQNREKYPPLKGETFEDY